MGTLLLFAFIAGLVTVLSPCVLPLLPIILSGGISGNKERPWGIIVGFILSFSTATLVLSALVKTIGIDANVIRNGAISILAVFGLVLAIPAIRHVWEGVVSRHLPQGITTRRTDFWGGILMGMSLGIVWTPCVGPILASVIALAASADVTAATTLIVIAYAVGTAIPLFAIMRGSSKIVGGTQWLKSRSGQIQQLFGVFMVLTAFALVRGWDRQFQIYILNRFPQYGAGLTSIENRDGVTSKLNELKTGAGSLNTLKVYGDAPELTGGGQWLNSDPLTLSRLRGKVVLLDFWTYSCINCIRTLPYLKAWDQKYAAEGLVIIGIHTPEFEFEKDYDNVKKAIRDFDILYPVVQDNNFSIWDAYDNHYWPAKYLIDKEGKIRLTHFGEGNYEETEMAIKDLLGETDRDIVDVPGYTVETRSPETYVGYKRLDGEVSSPAVRRDAPTSYSAPVSLPLNSLAFQGSWNVHSEYAEASVGSSLFYHFDAKSVNLVMRPIDAAKPASVDIYIGDQKISTQTIDKDRLYQLIKLDTRENKTLKVVFPDGNVAVYAFTFG